MIETKNKLFLIFAIIVLVFMTLIIQKGPVLNEKQPILQSGKALKKPLEIIDFQLIDQKNQLFTKNDLKDHFTLLFFGYTNCPDVCPSTIYKLSQMKKKINKDLPEKNLEIVFITLDPERDTTNRLHEYMNFFDSTMIGLTGDISEIVKLSANLSVFFQRINKEDGYDFNHTASIFIINQEAQLGASLSPISSLEMLEEDIKILLTK
tara:strand:+ start:54 stop:674 length:621 start_codon:yes stop_codon:yes gene_type:complete